MRSDSPKAAENTEISVRHVVERVWMEGRGRTGVGWRVGPGVGLWVGAAEGVRVGEGVGVRVGLLVGICTQDQRWVNPIEQLSRAF